jgi:hypothetical protein
MGPHEIGLEGVDWIDLAQDRDVTETFGMCLMHRISLLIEELSDPQEGLFCVVLVIVRKTEGCSKQNVCVSTLLEIEDSEQSCVVIM